MSHDRLELVLEMLEKNPKDVFLKYAAAIEYRKIDEDEKAIKHIEELLDIDPEYLGAYYTLGHLYEQKDEIEKAINIYKKGKAVAKKQNDQKTIGELTEALMLLDEEEENW
jgi:lipopolysaccharide biosynthesis regulator YciM